MFANVRVNSGEENRYHHAAARPRITFNPYGATRYSWVKPSDKKEDTDEKGEITPARAQQVFVTTGPTRGDQVAILKGIEAEPRW
mgnify:CR=1 FL=1